MTTNEILSRLEGVKGRDGQWIARCPAHSDKKQSLSISEAKDGRTLLHCHAGCGVESIVQALGITMNDLFTEKRERKPEARGKNRSKIVKVYNYRDETGATVLQKCRREDKSFFWSRPDGKGGWKSGRGDIPHRLYVAGDLSKQGIAVCEGEKDADSLHALGFNAVSGENGAGPGKWLPEYTEQLKGKNIIIFGDNDEVGRAYAEETANALHGVARIVQLFDLRDAWPEIPEHGDISDLIAAFGAERANEAIDRLIKNTPEWIPTEKKALASIHEESYRPPDFSDAGNEEVFSRIHKDGLIYVNSLGWLFWNGKKWVRDDHKPLEYAKALSKDMLAEAQKENRQALGELAEAQAQFDESGDQDSAKVLDKAKEKSKSAKAYLKHANTLRNASRLKSVVDLAIPTLVIPVEKLDASPNEINTPNGIVDLLTGKTRPHDRTSYCSKMMACAPGDKGRYMWETFLDTITEGDDSLKGFLQMVAGMAMYGTVYHEGIIMAYGGGRNGKSTFFNALNNVFGDYGGSIDVKVLTTDRGNKGASLATLRGKRLVVTGELEEGQRLSTSILKQIASTDSLVIEEKYRQPETVRQSHSLVLSTNYLPRVGSTDGGTWRRLTIVPFTATIPADGGVQNYAEVLSSEAGEAIASWAIEGARLFALNKYRLPIHQAVEDATADYRERENWLGTFISECCECSPTYRLSAKELYAEYKEWAAGAGEYIRQQKDFATAMEAAGYKKIRPGNKVVYLGIKLNTSPVYAGKSMVG